MWCHGGSGRDLPRIDSSTIDNEPVLDFGMQISTSSKRGFMLQNFQKELDDSMMNRDDTLVFFNRNVRLYSAIQATGEYPNIQRLLPFVRKVREIGLRAAIASCIQCCSTW